MLNIPDALPDEEWRSVVGYEAHYAISNFGRVYSLPRYRRGKSGAPTRVKGRYMKTRINSAGYEDVLLRKDNERTTRSQHFTIHKLVALAFLGARPEGHQVDHIDSNRLNNRLENLRWLPALENFRRSSAAKLNKLAVAKIMQEVKSGKTQTQVAAEHSIAFGTVSKIMRGTRWRDITQCP